MLFSLHFFAHKSIIRSGSGHVTILLTFSMYSHVKKYLPPPCFLSVLHICGISMFQILKLIIILDKDNLSNTKCSFK